MVCVSSPSGNRGTVEMIKEDKILQAYFRVPRIWASQASKKRSPVSSHREALLLPYSQTAKSAALTKHRLEQSTAPFFMAQHSKKRRVMKCLQASLFSSFFFELFCCSKLLTHLKYRLTFLLINNKTRRRRSFASFCLAVRRVRKQMLCALRINDDRVIDKGRFRDSNHMLAYLRHEY